MYFKSFLGIIADKEYYSGLYSVILRKIIPFKNLNDKRVVPDLLCAMIKGPSLQ